MKLYFFLTIVSLIIQNETAFSQADMTSPPLKPTPALSYPAIKISDELAKKLSLSGQKIVNCPTLFSYTWTYPNGSSIALCDDAQLACLRYGLLVKEIETAKGKYLEELKKTLIIEKQEITIRLRGCELALKRTINGEALQEAAGYPIVSTGETNRIKY